MNTLFNHCVTLLQNWATALGMTYEEINIWIFVILEPLVFVGMVVWIVRLRRIIKRQRALNPA